MLLIYKQSDSFLYLGLNLNGKNNILLTKLNSKELVKTDANIILSGAQLKLNLKTVEQLFWLSSGQAGAKAILDIVFGLVNPSGRLAETLPIKYEDVSSAPYFPGKEVTVEYRESLFVGYRYFDKTNTEVAYPFGFGLSYTTFEYSDIKVDQKGVKFNVKNTGSIKGSDVAQLYIGFKDSKIFRALKELKRIY